MSGRFARRVVCGHGGSGRGRRDRSGRLRGQAWCRRCRQAPHGPTSCAADSCPCLAVVKAIELATLARVIDHLRPPGHGFVGLQTLAVWRRPPPESSPVEAAVGYQPRPRESVAAALSKRGWTTQAILSILAGEGAVVRPPEWRCRPAPLLLPRAGMHALPQQRRREDDAVASCGCVGHVGHDFGGRGGGAEGPAI